MDIYVRRFNSNKVVEKTTNSHPFSFYFPEPMRTALIKEWDKNYIVNSDFLLCPLYDAGDFQVGITGSTKYNEDYTAGIYRELGEEVGLIPSKESKLNKVVNSQHMKRRNPNSPLMRVFSLDIKNTIPVQKHQQNLEHKGKDYRKRRVGCFVYGTENAILDFMETPKIYVYKSDDDIVGLVAIKMRDVLEHFNI